ncbi:MAG: DNRLRE domain-containing protein, partial [Actinobacteria bacterium]|nr:DNRLRE domain-containing protein [Actinomycetota bacterium]
MKRRRVSWLLAVLLALQGLQSVPHVAAQEPAPEETGPAAEGSPPSEPTPLTDADRIPVPAPTDLNGVLDPPLGTPEFGDALTPEGIFSDEFLVPEEGEASMDVYAPGPDVGAHLAVVSADLFNVLAPDGKWEDAALVADGTGWSLQAGAFTAQLPASLGPDSPVTFEVAGHVVGAVPVGVKGAPGTVEGTTVRYEGALPGADLVYEITATGVKEEVVLDGTATPALAWTVTAPGLDLILTPEGEVSVELGKLQVATIPAPVIYDSAVPPAEAKGTYTLAPSADGSYLLSLVIDPGFLAQATYPVVVDPGLTQPGPSIDTYVDSNQPSQGHSGSTTLITGPKTTKRTFIKFPTSWQQAGRLVYSAEIWLKNITQNNTFEPITGRRVTSNWGTGVNWNNQPVADTPPPERNDLGATGGWFKLQMKNLYQRYNDGEYPDYGVRIHSTDSKTFHSSEGTTAPYLLVEFNDLPAAPTPTGPGNGVVVETNTPTLKISGLPTDPNGDEVLVRYQLTENQGTWSGPGTHTSGWTDETTFQVPSSWLTDGGQYWWRVQSADICAQPETFCDNTDGTGATRDWNASSVRSFTVLKKGWGNDERYAMWSEDIGNGMTLKVNKANGNLFLQVPLDRLPTPLGKLRIGLSYNSQAAEEGIDKGLGPGWRLYAGPASSGRRLPVELVALTPAPSAGVKVVYAGGGHDIFSWRGGKAYHNVGSPSVVEETADGGFTFRGADGDVFTFDSAGKLTSAAPVYTKAKVAQGNPSPYYSYQFNLNNKLVRVTDPIGRRVDIDWTTVGGVERPTAIHVWGGHDFTLQYSGGTLIKVTTPASETVRFFHGATCNGQSLLDEIRNGQQFSGATPGWRIEHFFDTGNQNFPLCRVKRLYPPQASGGSEHWLLGYGSTGYKGTTSLTTTVTDPRGRTTPADDYKTTVDFSFAGFPIRIVAPKADPATEPNWITTLAWDSDGKLLCARSPQANAIDPTKCSSSVQAHELNTVYDHAAQE